MFKRTTGVCGWLVYTLDCKSSVCAGFKSSKWHVEDSDHLSTVFQVNHTICRVVSAHFAFEYVHNCRYQTSLRSLKIPYASFDERMSGLTINGWHGNTQIRYSSSGVNEIALLVIQRRGRKMQELVLLCKHTKTECISFRQSVSLRISAWYKVCNWHALITHAKHTKHRYLVMFQNAHLNRRITDDSMLSNGTQCWKWMNIQWN